MTITFNDGTVFNYTQAFAQERDYRNGYTRPSLSVTMLFSQTKFDDLFTLLSSEAVNKIVLTGDPMIIVDENGETVEGDAPTNTYEGYNVIGDITVSDDMVTYKLYQQVSSIEKERDEAIAAVDELLLIIEEG